MIERGAAEDQAHRGAAGAAEGQRRSSPGAHGVAPVARKRPERDNRTLERQARAAPADAAKELDELPPLVGGRIKDETLWACTTCGACQEVCPVFIDHPLKILQMRTHLVLTESRMPAELARTFQNLEKNSNPWGIAAEKRMEWAEGLEVPTVESNPNPEYLLFVGCAGAFDDRIKKHHALARRGAARGRGQLRGAGRERAVRGRSGAARGQRVPVPDAGRSQRHRDQRRQDPQGDRVLPALLPHHQERVPAVRRQVRGDPPLAAAGAPSGGEEADHRAPDGAEADLSRQLLSRPLERRVRRAARHRKAPRRRSMSR